MSKSPTDTVVDMDKAPAWPPVRHPYQVSSMGAFFAIGLGLAISPPTTFLSEGIVLLWNVVAVVSGLCGVVSALLTSRSPSMSLLLERVALIGLAGYSLIYTLVLLGEDGLLLWNQCLVFFLFTVASVWRFCQVQKLIVWMKKKGCR